LSNAIYGNSSMYNSAGTYIIDT